MMTVKISSQTTSLLDFSCDFYVMPNRLAQFYDNDVIHCVKKVPGIRNLQSQRNYFQKWSRYKILRVTSSQKSV